MKRAYYQSLRVPRKTLKEYELTPARFDVLCAIYRNAHHECFRADLVAVIGTVKSNVWRLCDALEKMGLAKADWEAWRIIKLTKEGIACVERILRECADMVEEVVDACAAAYARRDKRAEEPTEEPKTKRKEKKTRLTDALVRVRAALGDAHVFDVYADNYRKRLWAIRIIPRAQKYFSL